MSCHNTLEKAFTWRKKRVEYLISEYPLSYLKHGPHYLSSTQLLFFEQYMYLSAPIRTQRKKNAERRALTEPQATRASDLNGLKEGWAEMLSTKPSYPRKEKWRQDGKETEDGLGVAEWSISFEILLLNKIKIRARRRRGPRLILPPMNPM